jgi:hypothetical protein
VAAHEASSSSSAHTSSAHTVAQDLHDVGDAAIELAGLAYTAVTPRPVVRERERARMNSAGGGAVPRTHEARRARLMSATPKRDHEDARPATGSPPVAPGEAEGPSKHARGPAGRMHGGYPDAAAAASTTEPAAEPAAAVPAAAAAAVVPTTTAADAEAALRPQPLSGEQNARLMLALADADPNRDTVVHERAANRIMMSQLATLHAGGFDANSACNDEFVNIWLSFLVDRHRRQVDRSFANVYDSLADARCAVAIKKLYWQLMCHQQVLPNDLIDTVGMQIELKVEFKLPSIYCAPTALYTRMASNDAFNYAFVQRWTKTKTVPIISSHDLIFIPVVCLGWGLAVVNMHAKTIQFFQSFAPAIHVRRYVFLQFFQSFAAPNISCISTTVE